MRADTMMNICDAELRLARFIRTYPAGYEYMLQHPVGPVEEARDQFVLKNLHEVRTLQCVLPVRECPKAVAVLETMEKWDLGSAAGCYERIGDPVSHAQRLKSALSADIASIKDACKAVAVRTEAMVQGKFTFTAPVEFDAAGWTRMMNEVVYERQKLKARLADVEAVEHLLGELTDLRRCINMKGEELDAKRVKRGGE